MLAPSLRLMLVKSGCRRICGETDGPEERTGQNMSKYGLVDHASRTFGRAMGVRSRCPGVGLQTNDELRTASGASQARHERRREPISKHKWGMSQA